MQSFQDNFLGFIVTYVQTWGPVFPTLGLLVTALLALGCFYRFFGISGVYLYMAMALIVANLQVLKIVQFGFLPHPIAMGTAVFSTLFLASDILTEFHGPAVARRGVYMGFAAQGLFTILLFLTLCVRPDFQSLEMQVHLEALFLPTPALFLAGIIAFLVGQLYDIYIYQAVRRWTGEGYLWLRAGLAYMVGAFLDNLIFGVLAWRIFALEPVSWAVLFKTYILGAYALRLFFGICNMGCLYAFKRIDKGTSFK